MSGNRQVKFEIYAMQGGRWNIHAHFDANDRDDAIEEAMRLERQASVSASCVMRASYNSISNESTDTVIYHSPSLSGRPSAASLSKGGGGRTFGAVLPSGGEALAPPGSAAANAAADYVRRNSEFQAKQRRDATASKAVGGRGNMGEIPDFIDPYEDDSVGLDMVRLSLAFLLSSIVATGAAGAVYMVVRAIELNIGRNTMLITLASTFGITFLLFFIPMVRRIVASGRGVRRSVDDTPMPIFVQATPDENYETSPNIVEEPDPASIVIESEISSEITPAEELIFDLEDPSQIEGFEGELDSKPEDEDDFFPEENTAKPLATIEEVIAPEVKQPMMEEKIVAPDSLKELLMVLVNEVSAKYGAALGQDAYLRFGATLFLAGAAETIAREFGVAKKQYLKILVQCVTKTGTEPAHARGFCANIDEYLLDERYLGMFGAGRNAGKSKLKSIRAKSGFIDWMDYWINPATQTVAEMVPSQAGVPAGKRFVAVLFTDIVDSTGKQQQMGDEWMMHVVRSHNKAVRSALKDSGGREVKHMGDGIMASFPAVADAVTASIAMQRGFDKECADNPEHQFTVRIGISAGEPIHESGDIYGTPVNLAARVLTKAAGGEIAISSVGKDMCVGQNFNFLEIGAFELKGFNEPQLIFHVNLA